MRSGHIRLISLRAEPPHAGVDDAAGEAPPALAQRLAQLPSSRGDDPRTSRVQITDEFLPPLPLPSLELAQLPLRSVDAGLDALLLEALAHPLRLLTPRHTGGETARATDRRGIHSPGVYRTQVVGANQPPGHPAGKTRLR